MSEITSPESRSLWLAQSLSSLLASPHVHIPNVGIEMGPGPVDMFSVRFDQMFTPDAQGFVCGEEVDRESLKESLLGLQRRWNEKEGTCKASKVHQTELLNFHVGVLSIFMLSRAILLIASLVCSRRWQRDWSSRRYSCTRHIMRS